MELPLVMGVLLSSQLHSQHQVTIRSEEHANKYPYTTSFTTSQAAIFTALKRASGRND
ncbi:hypothetical protein HO173_011441 [Letharia columbiana]|uniref:Uncharacterized protein n=1 Tax=Letharia columbiana TaxID=112416 RepID=A0A8H6FJ80_9LECA|nr:uncharacterized protein HO173_011441 [Letharia columbiana]KAF6229586.1 hypothetical protein HO173_011441 [Letharia columbiana]